MAAPKFNKVQREAHLVTVAQEYLAGKTQAEIGERVGVSRQQIGIYLRTLQDRWQIQAGEALEARKARELARLDRLEREYWLAWAKSQLNAETVINRSKTITLKEKSDEGLIQVPADEKEYTLTSRGQAGDPRFLDGVKNCIEMRLKIIGGFAPHKLDVTWRTEVIELLRSGKVAPDAVVEELGPDLASELFIAAGIPLASS